MTTQQDTTTSLPVSVLEVPHWRVNFRAVEKYEKELIPSLSDCFELIEHTKVRLRGWDYPHLSYQPNERNYGSNWVASWSNFMGLLEYWRLYQSGQFLHLFSIKEVANPSWKKDLEAATKFHLQHITDIDWSVVPGFIDIINFLYTVTEIFEFAARLCQKDLYRGTITISIHLKNVSGFLLTVDERSRLWRRYYATSENILGHSWNLRSDVLVASSSEQSFKATAWFFERFGWTDPTGLKKDQETFLKGLV